MGSGPNLKMPDGEMHDNFCSSSSQPDSDQSKKGNDGHILKRDAA